ncbi:MAG: glycosyltransferase family 87 protein [Candidatus Thorarchaeota archaeon]
MEIKKFFFRIKVKFKELWEHKIFRYAIIIQIFYFVISQILTLTVFRNTNDFEVYYTVGNLFVNNINDLYNPSNYLWPFRYFPISAILFVPFYLVGFELGFILFTVINFILNALICIILYKIIILTRGKTHENNDARPILYICIFLMSLPNLFNYILGQINLYVTLLVLLSLFIFLRYEGLKWELIASIILGISINIKPTTVFMIPFLLVINIDLKNKLLKFEFKKSFIRLFGIILPVSINLIMFLIFPSLLEGFLATNFTTSEPSQVNHSFSITKLLINFFVFIGFTEGQIISIQMPLFLTILMIIGIIGFISFITRKHNNYSLVYGYTLGILIMFLCYFDSWDHHLLNLIPLLIIILFNLPRNSDLTKKFIKPSIIFFSFLDLAFMGIYFLVDDFFPFNFASTIFLILVFYGIIKLNNFNKKRE